MVSCKQLRIKLRTKWFVSLSFVGREKPLNPKANRAKKVEKKKHNKNTSALSSEVFKS